MRMRDIDHSKARERREGRVKRARHLERPGVEARDHAAQQQSDRVAVQIRREKAHTEPPPLLPLPPLPLPGAASGRRGGTDRAGLSWCAVGCGGVASAVAVAVFAEQERRGVLEVSAREAPVHPCVHLPQVEVSVAVVEQVVAQGAAARGGGDAVAEGVLGQRQEQGAEVVQVPEGAR